MTATAEPDVERVTALIATRPTGLRRLYRAVAALRRSKRGLLGLSILLVFGLAAVLAPLLAAQDPSSPTALSEDIFASPSWRYPLGTDEQGKDVLSQLFYGGRTSLAVGLIAAAIATTIGATLGILAGYFGGLVDRLIVVVDDWFLVIPFLPVAMLVVSLLGGRADGIPLGQAGVMALVIGLFGWAGTSRIVRAEVLSLRERSYVERSRALGAPAARTMRRHILRNVMPLVLANAVLFVSSSILAETMLAFLGLGDPLRPSWGTMLNNSYANDAVSNGAWWYFVTPGLCVTTVVMGFALLGHALEQLADQGRDEVDR